MKNLNLLDKKIKCQELEILELKQENKELVELLAKSQQCVTDNHGLWCEIEELLTKWGKEYRNYHNEL